MRPVKDRYKSSSSLWARKTADKQTVAQKHFLTGKSLRLLAGDARKESSSAVPSINYDPPWQRATQMPMCINTWALGV